MGYGLLDMGYEIWVWVDIASTFTNNNSLSHISYLLTHIS